MLAALLAHPDLCVVVLEHLVDAGCVREALALLDLSHATAVCDSGGLCSAIGAWTKRLARSTGAAVELCTPRLDALHGVSMRADPQLAGGLEHALRAIELLSLQQRAVSALLAARGRLLLDMHTALQGVLEQLERRERRPYAASNGAAPASKAARGDERRHARSARDARDTRSS